MDYWKVTFSAKVTEPMRVNRFTDKVESVAMIFKKAKWEGDASYECAHRLMTYKLRADEGDVYSLPRPVCADCRREMTLTWLWGESMHKEAGLVGEEKEA